MPDGPRMCHDCGFLPDSPEREPGSAPVYYEGASVVQVKLMQLVLSVAGDGPELPFFCHQGIPVDEAGRYAPEAMLPGGHPAHGRRCAGWLAERERLAGVFAEGGRAGLEAAAGRRIFEEH